jgi:uncharacterized protein YndB with AHSA1/START domain
LTGRACTAEPDQKGKPVATVEQRISAPVERVFDILADGWSYSSWVVGASHIRKVDSGWPQPGTRIHHSVGPWPLVVKDVTLVEELELPHRLVLRARLWPFGAATVRFDLASAGAGATTVVMDEELKEGPFSRLPARVQAALLVPRNRETLLRLSDLATRPTGDANTRGAGG